jgi:hypothetical protein
MLLLIFLIILLVLIIRKIYKYLKLWYKNNILILYPCYLHDTLECNECNNLS